MTGVSALKLKDRGIVSLSGPDARSLLQGLVTNDVAVVRTRQAIYAALLTPQGKYLIDFFIAEIDDRLLLDVPVDGIADLIKRLTMYRLRSRVDIADVSSDFTVHAVFGDSAHAALSLSDEPGAAVPFGGGIAFTDPRNPAMGGRLILPAADAETVMRSADFVQTEPSDYDAHRTRLGIPARGAELVPQGSLPLECNFEALNGVDFDKGCYVGQEVTARMKHRNLVRKRLYALDCDGPAPLPGDIVTYGDKEVGPITSVADGSAIALLRVEHVEAARESGTPLNIGNATVTLGPNSPN